MLNWRRDPGYEQRVMHYEQRKMQHELRMKQLESEIELLRRENARQRALSALIKQHCFPDDFNSTPLSPTEPGSRSS
jgi:hypothetical protein